MFRNVAIVLLAAVSLVLFTSSYSHASDTDSEAILNVLMKKGVINQKEYEEIMGELKDKPSYKDSEAKTEQKTNTLDNATLDANRIPEFLHGLGINGNVTMVGQTTIGNKRNTPPAGDVTEGNIRAQIDVTRPLGDDGTLFFRTQMGAGSGLKGSGRVSTFWGINDTAADSSSNIWIREAWYEHKFLDKKVALTVGKLDITRYFDANAAANDENVQFQASGFINNLAVEFPGYTAGTRLTISPDELVDISLGWQPGDSAWSNLFNKPFLIAEVGVKPKIGELQGNYRLYGWTNQTDHTQILDPTATTDKGYGLGISVDHQLSKCLTVFGRAGYQSPKIYNYDVALSGGVSVNGLAWHRDEDVFGIAYGTSLLSGDYKESLSQQAIAGRNEHRVEAYYNAALNKYIVVGPDYQFISNALGVSDFKSVSVTGLRARIVF
ncbi:MAG: carbohydrate porin [Candidatus Magnetominusculus sp. LBB02]|nr:carbohydrate porin [Candidatus Magnetominusculus sp. LBB02]